MADVAAIVLAAGRGARFGAAAGSSKLTALLNGKPIVRHVAEAALASRAAPVVVVLGHAAQAVGAAIAGLPLTATLNPDYAMGLAGSLKTGLAALPPTAAGAVVLLGDMPLVPSALVDRLIETFVSDSPDAVVPTYRERDGNPTLIGRTLFDALAELDGDEGARRLLAAPHRRIVRYPCDDPGILADVDTRTSLRRLNAFG